MKAISQERNLEVVSDTPAIRKRKKLVILDSKGIIDKSESMI